jgi:hypothetical protein
MDKRNKPTERSSRALKRLEAHLVSPNNEESFRGHVGHISSTEDSPADKNAGSARRSVGESEDRRRSRSPSRISKSRVERGEIEAVVLVEAVETMHVKGVEAVRVLEQEVLKGNIRAGRIRRPRNRQRGQKNCFVNNDKTRTS